jgi:hypothetical protein
MTSDQASSSAVAQEQRSDGFPKVVQITLLGSRLKQKSTARAELDNFTFTYTVDIRNIPPTDEFIAGLCDCFLVGKLRDEEMFNFNAWYAYFLESSPQYDEVQIENFQRILARTAIWAKFADVAWMTLNQAGIERPSLPVAPSEVTLGRLDIEAVAKPGSS